MLGIQLTRSQLELINRRTIRYPLQIAEKDYFLALAMQRISTSHLREKLIFKGGTALHHCYLNQYRFSEDLDFTSIAPQITPEEIVAVLEEDGLFKVNKIYDSDFTIKIERLQYQGLLDQPGNIKLELDHHQNVVLPGLHRSYNNVWRVEASPSVMDKTEIFAEKLRAVSQRARYRDFYDLYFLHHELKINFDEAIDLLKQKEIRSPITSHSLIENWAIAQEQQERDLGRIYCSQTVSNQRIETLVRSFKFEDIT
jgi:predicted nucleotidyltransferase component of viral defense system